MFRYLMPQVVLTVFILFAAGCAIDRSHEGWTTPQILDEAVRVNDKGAVMQYIGNGGDPDIIVEPVTEETMLHLAATENRPSIAKMLLKAGAHPEIEDNLGWTPMMYAVDKVNSEVCQVLAPAYRFRQSADVRIILAELLIRKVIPYTSIRAFHGVRYRLSIDGGPSDEQLLSRLKDIRFVIVDFSAEGMEDAWSIDVTIQSMTSKDAYLRAVVSDNKKTTKWFWTVTGKKRYGVWTEFIDKVDFKTTEPSL